MHLTFRKSCRICGSTALTRLIDLGPQHLQGSFIRAERYRQELNKLLKDLKRSGKSVHIYGASTKGNTILQWCGIDSSVITCAADPEKVGAHTIGTEIPIVSEEESRAMNPNYYLVLPWHFREAFVQRERETWARSTKCIFPLPEIQIAGG